MKWTGSRQRPARFGPSSMQQVSSAGSCALREKQHLRHCKIWIESRPTVLLFKSCKQPRPLAERS